MARSIVPVAQGRHIETLGFQMRKKRRVVLDVPIQWALGSSSATPIEILGDNELVINWLNGLALVKQCNFSSRIENLAIVINKVWKLGCIRPRVSTADWARHVYRELNTKADALADLAMDSRTCSAAGCNLIGAHAFRGYFDGGRRDDGMSAFGWHIQASFKQSDDREPSFDTVASASVLLQQGTSSTDAELHGLEQVTLALLSLAMDGAITFNDCFVQLK